MSLTASLDSINQSADSIKSLYFTPSGMFTNAMTLKPELTKLMRDTTESEASLYVVNKEANEVRRADGSKSYMYYVNQEYMDPSGEDIDNNNNNRDNSNNSNKRAAVRIPDVRIDHVIEKEDYKIHSLLNKLQNERHTVDVLIASVRDLVESNRSLLGNQVDIVGALDEKSNKFANLSKEVEELEQLVEQQKRQLNKINKDINNNYDTSTNGDSTSSELEQQDTSSSKTIITKISASELIEKEEQEIRELEMMLTSKKKEEKRISNSIVNDN